MNITVLLNALAMYLNEFFREELDPSLKPTDLSSCTKCRNMEYDFIIVGAGAAGCVLANRLSENPNWNVLLIEAGGDEDYITDIPALSGHFTGTKYDWNFTTVKQESVCQDNDGYCKFPQGYVMGGSSTIGDMVYMRGNPKDYDEWAELGNPGWSYKDVLPYFLKSEKIEISGMENSTYHSTKGLLPVSYAHFNSTIFQKYIKVAVDNGAFVVDPNSLHQTGMSYNQLNIEGVTRSSSSKSFLNPIRKRQNLSIFKNTLVSKILFSNDAKRKATGVVCVTDGQEYKVYSSKEVILSAGAINTPKLLMLSGIGPKKHLEELGIPVYADLSVGENLIDLPGSKMLYRTNEAELIYDDASLNNAMLDYAKNRKGVLSSPQRPVMALYYLDPMGQFDVTKRPNTIYNSGYSLPDLSFDEGMKFPSLAFYNLLLTPTSRGTVKLKSNSYKDAPLIDPNYLSSASDFQALGGQILLIVNFHKLKNWYNSSIEFIAPSQCKYDGNTTEEFLTCYIKYVSNLGVSPISTAKMGPASDKTAVVDSNLKVHTIDNLRVVDASVIPKPIRALPYATVDMIAEKASEIIRNYY